MGGLGDSIEPPKLKELTSKTCKNIKWIQSILNAKKLLIIIKLSLYCLIRLKRFLNKKGHKFLVHCECGSLNCLFSHAPDSP